MNELPVSVGFPFQREFIPRKCRLARTEWFRAKGSALVRVIELREADPAFIVNFPRRTWYSTTGLRTLSESSLNLLHYDGAIWWPLFIWEGDRSPHHEIPTDGFFSILDEQYDLFGFIPDVGVISYDRRAFEYAREICRDDEERNLAVVVRKVRENFLICDDRVFIRGGAPVYTRGWVDNSYVDRLLSAEALSLGTIRSREHPAPICGRQGQDPYQSGQKKK
jgi:hypothetical protein